MSFILNNLRLRQERYLSDGLQFLDQMLDFLNLTNRELSHLWRIGQLGNFFIQLLQL